MTDASPPHPQGFSFQLPAWLITLAAQPRPPLPEPRDRMALVIDAARRNVRHGSGGPFAAAVFTRDAGELVSLGVNLVTTEGSSVLHAEIIALMLAQRRLGQYQLAAPGLPACELVSSTEPCAMCLGAIPWSGVRRLLIGARDADARAIGFDEGDKPRGWQAVLARRGIETRRDLCRTEAAQVLRDYVAAGGVIYNAGG